jgi:hypothetical protein
MVLLAGALALGGTAAFAASNDVHHMTVRLSDGSVAQIEYAGDVAPKISVAPMTQADFNAFAPGVAFGPAFMPVDFARIQADMNRQMNAMLQQASAMDAYMARVFSDANGPIEATLNGAPSNGSNVTTLISAKGGNFCSRSVEVSIVNGKKNVVRHQSGNCGSSAAAEHAPAHHGDRI